MHSHTVSDTDQDICACLYCRPVISILAAGDKAHKVSVRLQLAFFQGTSGQQHCEHLGQPTNGPSFITQLTHTTPLNTSSSYTHLLV